jgi:hypothetical protein
MRKRPTAYRQRYRHERSRSLPAHSDAWLCSDDLVRFNTEASDLNLLVNPTLKRNLAVRQIAT